MCGHGDIGRRLSIEGIHDEIYWVWDPTAYKAFFAMLSDLRNPEACFFSRIKAVFMKTGDAMISGASPRVGTMRRPIYTPSCSTGTMAVPPLTTPRSGT
jgi:hypothetical protein